MWSGKGDRVLPKSPVARSTTASQRMLMSRPRIIGSYLATIQPKCDSDASSAAYEKDISPSDFENNAKVAAERPIDLGQCAVLHSVIFWNLGKEGKGAY
jgi:hypothetical protein